QPRLGRCHEVNNGLTPQWGLLGLWLITSRFLLLREALEATRGDLASASSGCSPSAGCQAPSAPTTAFASPAKVAYLADRLNIAEAVQHSDEDDVACMRLNHSPVTWYEAAPVPKNAASTAAYSIFRFHCRSARLEVSYFDVAYGQL
ncbi:MAG TPA: hypothetical protein VIY68_00725, partial [Steroidobacteraceae bacterium]